MTQIFLQADQKAGPVPASGRRSEMLTEISIAASTLIKLVELEKSGVYDGAGQNCWIGFDSVLSGAQKVLALTEQLRAEMRDGGA